MADGLEWAEAGIARDDRALAVEAR